MINKTEMRDNEAKQRKINAISPLVIGPYDGGTWIQLIPHTELMIWWVWVYLCEGEWKALIQILI